MGSIRPVSKHFVTFFGKTCNIRVILMSMTTKTHHIEGYVKYQWIIYSDKKRTTFFAIVCFLSFFSNSLCAG